MRLTAPAAIPHFGTDGWRAAIAGEYTFDNVRLVTQAIAEFAKAEWRCERGIVVGYDTRFGSERFARTVCEVLAANGIRALVSRDPVPTPACAYSISQRSAAGGIIVTASHNPPSDNGIKVRDSAGAATPPEDLEKIEQAIRDRAGSEIAFMPYSEALQAGLIEEFDPKSGYIEGLRSAVDVQRLSEARYPVVIDSMWGAGAGYATALLADSGMDIRAIRGDRNPAFPGISRPEPIPPHTSALSEAVLATGARVGFANDGDADRLGVVDEQGRFVDQLRTMSLLAYYMIEHRGARSPIVKTVTTSSMLDRIGEMYGIRIIETGVGMKHVAPEMAKSGAFLGGEESGGYVFAHHMPERDGILAGLLFLDLMVREGKSPSELVEFLFEKLGREFHYARRDLIYPESGRERIESQIAGYRPNVMDGSQVVEFSAADGLKYSLEDGSWFLIRFSGTEPLLRIYTETTSAARAERILAAAAAAAGL